MTQDHPARAASAAPTLVVLAAGQAKRYGGGVKPLAPVGTMGEAVIDVLASDALAAGFSRILLVVGPSTGPAIRYHVERTWPAAVDVAFAVQEVPEGTVDAMLTAARHLDPRMSFGVANADDIYGEEGLALLARHLAGPEPSSALVSYRLRDSLIGDAPVTRAICHVGPDGMLRSIDERRKVTPADDGGFVAHDGREPAELDGDWPVSVNLWGFRADVLAVFEAAIDAAPVGQEVLLPEVVGELLAQGSSAAGVPRITVLESTSRCIGVTHPGDLPLVGAALAAQVARGERPATLWTAVRAR